MIACCLLLSTAITVNAQTFEPAPDGTVVMEAENYSTNTAQGAHVWSEDFTLGYVGDSAMRASPNSGTTLKSSFASDAPRLDFEVDFASAGSLNVWLRGLGTSWNSDSVWIGLNGNPSGALFASPPKGAYGWVRPAGFLTIPSAGVHTINVWMREDGTIVDRLLLTPDGSLRPAGDGPPESGQEGGGSGNTWPIAVDDVFEVSEDSAGNALMVLADTGGGVDFDPDGDLISIVAASNPGSAGGDVSVNASANGLIYTPAPDFVGTEKFTYTISDGRGGTGSASVTVTVTNSNNDPPNLAPVGNRSATESQLLTFNVTASDVDGSPLPSITADLSSLSGSPLLTNNGNGSATFSWTPSAGDAPGPYAVTFIATDAINGSLQDSETISISVQSSGGGGGGGTGAFLPSASGLVVMEAESFSGNLAQGAHAWTDDFTPGFVGVSSMRATPDSGTTVKTSIGSGSPRLDFEVDFATTGNMNVWLRGLGPGWSSDSVWIGIDGNASGVLLASPPKNAYGWVRPPGSVFVPTPGIHTINVWMREDGTIVDRLLLTPDGSVRPSGDGPAESSRAGGGGEPDNTWPIANDDNFVVAEDSSSNSLAVLFDNGAGADFDPDGDPIAIVSASSVGSAGGSISINAAADGLLYTPQTDFAGIETFSYTIADGRGGSGTATVTATVTNSDNDLPVLAPVGNRVVTEGQVLNFTVTASDVDGVPLPIMTANLTSLGGTPSFSDNGNGTANFNWTPAVGTASGPYNVTFTATDAVNGSLQVSETISITVQSGGGGGGGTGAYLPSVSGQVVIETEHFSTNTAQGSRTWTADFTSGFVGESAMRAVPDAGTIVTSSINATSPRLDFEVDFASAGNLNVWLRGFGPSWGSDSVWIGIDGNASGALLASPSKSSYGWVRPAGLLNVPSAGVHTINVWMREDGTIVDRLLLTPDGSVRPTGDGPAESPRDDGSGGGGFVLPFTDDFSDGNADGWSTTDDSTQFPSGWSVVSNAFVQSEWTNSSGKDVTESYHRGSYALLNGSLGLSDYRVSVDITPAPASADDIGIMFRYVDNNNYYRLSLNSLNGFARLESNFNGTFLTLARNFRGYRPGESQAVVIEVEGPLLQVFVNGDSLFSAYDTDHVSGGIALYSRDNSQFDDVSITQNNSAPEIVIASPEAHSVLPNGPLDIGVTAVARNVPPNNGSVAIRYVGAGGQVPCDVAAESPAGVFTALCPGMPADDYQIEALLFDNGTEVDRDTNTSIAIGSSASGGHRYDAIGNSITRGIGDDFAADNLSLVDQRTIGFSGWSALLGDMLTASEGAPNLVGNEGIPGDRVSDTLFARLGSIVERNPDSNRTLLTIGTNDSNSFNTTTPQVLVSRIQSIVDDLLSAGRDRIYVATLPPAWGANLTDPFPDPLAASATRNQTIISYNLAIQSLFPQFGVARGPDLFSCFLTPTVNRFSLFKDNLHPNALGHAFIAALWHDAITGGPTAPPIDPCAAPIYILDSLDPYVHGHKQNLLETGDTYYVDETFTLTEIPPELSDGIWVTPRNADRNNSDASFLSFDVGPSAVTVYIAYDSTGNPPTSSTQTFGSVSLAGQLRVSDASVGAFSMVRATNVSGTVNIGGNRSNPAAPGQQNYLVIVVP